MYLLLVGIGWTELLVVLALLWIVGRMMLRLSGVVLSRFFVTNNSTRTQAIVAWVLTIILTPPIVVVVFYLITILVSVIR